MVLLSGANTGAGGFGMTIQALITVAFLAASLCAAGSHEFTFRADAAGEAVASLEMRSPGSDWSATGREAAVAAISVDGEPRLHVVLFAGTQPHVYRVFLGNIPAGEHRVTVVRDERHSAPGTGLDLLKHEVKLYQPDDPDYAVMAAAPVLFARRNTLGKFSDVPLLMYAERLKEAGAPLIQYTALFSNEDGGTSTRALMARWGRTTDIEYIYRVFLDPATGKLDPATGKPSRATVQGRDHKELPFTEPFEGRHPLLMPVTDNNMVAGEAPSDLRFQLAPQVVDLSTRSREAVMDEHSVLYRVMAQELEREGKLRPYGTVDGQKISDPRNYLYIEAEIRNERSRLTPVCRLKDQTSWRTGNLGRLDYGIERGGWIRTAVELPPGTTSGDIAEIGWMCAVDAREISGVCSVVQVSKAFLLDKHYAPGAPFWSMKRPIVIPSGEVATFPTSSR